MALEDLQLGQTYTVGGSGINAFTIGPLPWRISYRVYAWHTGYKTHEDTSADLRLFIDGAQTGHAHDGPFDTYSLSLSQRIELAVGTSVSVAIEATNSRAAQQSFGVQATIERI